jgi:hypothetical protein
MMKNKFKDKVTELKAELITTESNSWNLLDLERSYQFYIGELPIPKKELYFEHDELLGENQAFENNFALSMIDVLKKLEEELPSTQGIIAEDGRIELIRKKQISNPGMLIIIDGQVRDFFSDKAMATFNFLDFYEELKERLAEQSTQTAGN